MKRTWQMLVYDYAKRKYVKPTSDGTCVADGPKAAMKAIGLDHDGYTAEYSRRNYGYYTGMVRLYSPEAVAAREVGPATPDFILQVIHN